MKFYSGFSLKNDEIFFQDYLDNSDFCIAGFSYGAIKAFKDTLERVQNNKRVDKLQLISPAFFQTKNDKFKRLQLMGYNKDKEAYIDRFLQMCFDPYDKKDLVYGSTSAQDLEELLHFEWSISELTKLVEAGVIIEVYLGSEDKIIDVESAREFFLNIATVTYIKNGNHFLQTK